MRGCPPVAGSETSILGPRGHELEVKLGCRMWRDGCPRRELCEQCSEDKHEAEGRPGLVPSLRSLSSFKETVNFLGE